MEAKAQEIANLETEIRNHEAAYERVVAKEAEVRDKLSSVSSDLEVYNHLINSAILGNN